MDSTFFSRKIFTLLLFVYLSISACNIPIGEGSQDKPLLFDDFSDPNSGFPRYRGEGISDYENGVYRVKIEYADYFSWGITHNSFGDVRVEVDLGFAGGSMVGEMGLVCRWQDEFNTYLLTIRSDGKFGVLKKVDGVIEFVGMEDYQESSLILPGVSKNHLRADCIGNSLSLYVNGSHLITVEDNGFDFGDVGIMAGSFEEPNVDVYFDNFAVYQP